MWLTSFWRPPFYARRCLVNFRNEPNQAIRGIHWGTRWRWLTFRNAELLVPNKDATPLDGETVIHREQILFVQVLD